MKEKRKKLLSHPTAGSSGCFQRQQNSDKRILTVMGNPQVTV